MTGWFILAVLVALALAAPRYGADTRTGDSWTAGGGLRPQPRRGPSVRGDVVAVGRRLARLVHAAPATGATGSGR